MLTSPPPEPPAGSSRGAEVDVLIVGALTIDRFADGTSAAGGSVLHASRGLWLDGRSVAVVTLAGDEPEARAGLAELSRLALVDVEAAGQSVAFAHNEERPVRALRLLAPAELLSRAPTSVRPRAVLYAPVADELGPSLGGQVFDGVPTGAILQGWLRRLSPGEPVSAQPLDGLAAPLRERLAFCDLLACSTEDLAADAAAPGAQLAALRATFGPHPLLALTAGTEGAWLDDGSGTVQRIRPPRLIGGVPTVGAGDAFAAHLLDAMARGLPPLAAAGDAAALTAEMLAERSGRSVHIVGDVHGMADQLVGLLRDIGLIDAAASWSGGRDELWLSGDLVDRGPDGVAVLELLMRLSGEAAAAGGRVGSVLGNHEVLLLAAREIPDAPSGGPGGTMRGDWLANGGRLTDLARLTDDHVAWLRTLPVLVRVGAALLVHADARLYADLPSGPTAAVAALRRTLAAAEPDAWDALLAAFSDRRAFLHDPSLVDGLLARFGGRLLVHGHTGIGSLSGSPPASVRDAYVYARGRCVAVDPGLVRGGRPFAFRLPRAAEERIMRG